MDPVTVEVSSTPETPTESTSVEGLVVETVTAAATATATAETALAESVEATEAVEAVENEVRRIEEWQSNLTTSLSTTNDRVESLTAGFQAMSETMGQMLTLLQSAVIPQHSSEPGAGVIPADVSAESASPSEPRSPEAETAPNHEAEKTVNREQQRQATHWL